VNVTDHVLSVPLTYNQLNSMYSLTGQATPPESFTSGTSGFSIPEEYFTQPQGLVGVWKFLGQNMTLPTTLSACSDRAVPGACTPLDASVLRGPIEYTRQAISNLVLKSLAAARSGKWKGSGGKFSIPFLNRGAAAIALMERSFPYSTQQNFVCSVTPLSCTTVHVSKPQLIKAFSKIYDKNMPKGLQTLVANSEKEVAAFKKELKKVPDSYTACE
jgi:hypothetical protein